MLTAKQHELIRFIQRKLEETGISPSFEEMKEALPEPIRFDRLVRDINTKPRVTRFQIKWCVV